MRVIKTVQTPVPGLDLTLPLLPTEIIIGSEDQEESQDGGEDDYIAC